MIKRWSKNIGSEGLFYRGRLMYGNSAGIEIYTWRSFVLSLCFHEFITEADHEVRIVPLKARKGLVHLSDLNDRNLRKRRQHPFRFEVVFCPKTYEDGLDEDLCESRKHGRQYRRHEQVGRGDGHDTEKKGVKDVCENYMPCGLMSSITDARLNSLCDRSEFT